MTAQRFDAELGNRLWVIYGLRRKPRDPDDFFRLLRVESARHAGTQEFLDSVRSGKAVVGRSDVPTKDWIVRAGAEKVFTFCSYDILMTAVLQRDSVIGSSCPHCGEPMTARISGGNLKDFNPKRMVFLWGAGPKGALGNPMCDHLHLFPNKEHMNAWIASKEGETGFNFSLPEAVRRLRERF